MGWTPQLSLSQATSWVRGQDQDPAFQEPTFHPISGTSLPFVFPSFPTFSPAAPNASPQHSAPFTANFLANGNPSHVSIGNPTEEPIARDHFQGPPSGVKLEIDPGASDQPSILPEFPKASSATPADEDIQRAGSDILDASEDPFNTDDGVKKDIINSEAESPQKASTTQAPQSSLTTEPTTTTTVPSTFSSPTEASTPQTTEVSSTASTTSTSTTIEVSTTAAATTTPEPSTTTKFPKTFTGTLRKQEEAVAARAGRGDDPSGQAPPSGSRGSLASRLKMFATHRSNPGTRQEKKDPETKDAPQGRQSLSLAEILEARQVAAGRGSSLSSKLERETFLPRPNLQKLKNSLRAGQQAEPRSDQDNDYDQNIDQEDSNNGQENINQSNSTSSTATTLSMRVPAFSATRSENHQRKRRPEPHSTSQALMERVRKLREMRLKSTPSPPTTATQPRRSSTEKFEKSLLQPDTDDTTNSRQEFTTRNLNSRFRPSQRRTNDNFQHRLRNRLFTTRTPANNTTDDTQEGNRTVELDTLVLFTTKRPVSLRQTLTTTKPPTFRERFNEFRKSNRFIPKNRRRTASPVTSTTPSTTTTMGEVHSTIQGPDYDDVTEQIPVFLAVTEATPFTPAIIKHTPVTFAPIKHTPLTLAPSKRTPVTTTANWRTPTKRTPVASVLTESNTLSKVQQIRERIAAMLSSRGLSKVTTEEVISILEEVTERPLISEPTYSSLQPPADFGVTSNPVVSIHTTDGDNSSAKIPLDDLLASIIEAISTSELPPITQDYTSSDDTSPSTQDDQDTVLNSVTTTQLNTASEPVSVESSGDSASSTTQQVITDYEDTRDSDIITTIQRTTVEASTEAPVHETDVRDPGLGMGEDSWQTLVQLPDATTTTVDPSAAGLLMNNLNTNVATSTTDEKSTLTTTTEILTLTQTTTSPTTTSTPTTTTEPTTSTPTTTTEPTTTTPTTEPTTTSTPTTTTELTTTTQTTELTTTTQTTELTTTSEPTTSTTTTTTTTEPTTTAEPTTISTPTTTTTPTTITAPTTTEPTTIALATTTAPTTTEPTTTPTTTTALATTAAPATTAPTTTEPTATPTTTTALATTAAPTTTAPTTTSAATQTPDEITSGDFHIQDLISKLISQRVITKINEASSQTKQNITTEAAAVATAPEEQVVTSLGATTEALTSKINDEKTTIFLEFDTATFDTGSPIGFDASGDTSPPDAMGTLDESEDLKTSWVASTTTTFSPPTQRSPTTSTLSSHFKIPMWPNRSQINIPTNAPSQSSNKFPFSNNPLVSTVKMMDTTTRFNQRASDLVTDVPTTTLITQSQDDTLFDYDHFEVPSAVHSTEPSTLREITSGDENEVDIFYSTDNFQTLKRSFDRTSARPELAALNHVLGITLTTTTEQADLSEINLEKPEASNDYIYDDLEQAATEQVIYTASLVMPSNLGVHEELGTETTTGVFGVVTAEDDLIPTVLNMDVASLTVSEPSSKVLNVAEVTESSDMTEEPSSTKRENEAVMKITSETTGDLPKSPGAPDIQLKSNFSDITGSDVKLLWPSFPKDTRTVATSTGKAFTNTAAAQVSVSPAPREQTIFHETHPSLRRSSQEQPTDASNIGFSLPNFRHKVSNENITSTSEGSSNVATGSSKSAEREKLHFQRLMRDRQRGREGPMFKPNLPLRRSNVVPLEQLRSTSESPSTTTSSGKLSLSEIITQRNSQEKITRTPTVRTTEDRTSFGSHFTWQNNTTQLPLVNTWLDPTTTTTTTQATTQTQTQATSSANADNSDANDSNKALMRFLALNRQALKLLAAKKNNSNSVAPGTTETITTDSFTTAMKTPVTNSFTTATETPTTDSFTTTKITSTTESLTTDMPETTTEPIPTTTARFQNFTRRAKPRHRVLPGVQSSTRISEVIPQGRVTNPVTLDSRKSQVISGSRPTSFLRPVPSPRPFSVMFNDPSAQSEDLTFTKPRDEAFSHASHSSIRLASLPPRFHDRQTNHSQVSLNFHTGHPRPPTRFSSSQPSKETRPRIHVPLSPTPRPTRIKEVTAGKNHETRRPSLLIPLTTKESNTKESITQTTLPQDGIEDMRRTTKFFKTKQQDFEAATTTPPVKDEVTTLASLLNKQRVQHERFNFQERITTFRPITTHIPETTTQFDDVIFGPVTTVGEVESTTFPQNFDDTSTFTDLDETTKSLIDKTLTFQSDRTTISTTEGMTSAHIPPPFNFLGRQEIKSTTITTPRPFPPSSPRETTQVFPHKEFGRFHHSTTFKPQSRPMFIDPETTIPPVTPLLELESLDPPRTFPTVEAGSFETSATTISPIVSSTTFFEPETETTSPKLAFGFGSSPPPALNFQPQKNFPKSISTQHSFLPTTRPTETIFMAHSSFSSRRPPVDNRQPQLTTTARPQTSPVVTDENEAFFAEEDPPCHLCQGNQPEATTLAPPVSENPVNTTSVSAITPRIILLLPLGNSTIFSGSALPFPNILPGSALPFPSTLSKSFPTLTSTLSNIPSADSSGDSKVMMLHHKESTFIPDDGLSTATAKKELIQISSKEGILSKDSLAPPPPLRHMITKGVTITSEEGIISRDVLILPPTQEQQQEHQTSRQHRTLQHPQENLQVKHESSHGTQQNLKRTQDLKGTQHSFEGTSKNLNVEGHQSTTGEGNFQSGKQNLRGEQRGFQEEKHSFQKEHNPQGVQRKIQNDHQNIQQGLQNHQQVNQNFEHQNLQQGHQDIQQKKHQNLQGEHQNLQHGHLNLNQAGLQHIQQEGNQNIQQGGNKILQQQPHRNLHTHKIFEGEQQQEQQNTHGRQQMIQGQQILHNNQKSLRGNDQVLGDHNINGKQHIVQDEGQNLQVVRKSLNDRPHTFQQGQETITGGQDIIQEGKKTFQETQQVFQNGQSNFQEGHQRMQHKLKNLHDEQNIQESQQTIRHRLQNHQGEQSHFQKGQQEINQRQQNSQALQHKNQGNQNLQNAPHRSQNVQQIIQNGQQRFQEGQENHGRETIQNGQQTNLRGQQITHGGQQNSRRGQQSNSRGEHSNSRGGHNSNRREQSSSNGEQDNGTKQNKISNSNGNQSNHRGQQRTHEAQNQQPGSQQHLPRTQQNLPRTQQNLPRTQQNRPRNLQTFPGTQQKNLSGTQQHLTRRRPSARRSGSRGGVGHFINKAAGFLAGPADAIISGFSSSNRKNFPTGVARRDPSSSSFTTSQDGRATVGGRGGAEPMENDPDGDKIPGKGTVDYPVLEKIPETAFLCTPSLFKSSKMFADPETSCQVYHVCSGHQKFSFLCPRGTIFHQNTQVCQWWFTVDCEQQAQKLAEVRARDG